MKARQGGSQGGPVQTDERDGSVPADIWLGDAKYRFLIDHLQEAVFLIREGRLQFVNRFFARMLGCREDELIGGPITDVIAPEWQDLVLDRYRRRVAGEDIPASYGFDLLHSDGTRRVPVQMSVGVVREADGTVATIGTLTDISDQRRIMEELAKSEREFRAIIRNMPDILYRTDVAGKLTMVSPAVKEIVGYAPEEVIGTSITSYYVDPTVREDFLRRLRENRGRTTYVETQLRHKDGHAVWVATKSFLRFDDKGEPIGVEGIARDITERRVMEDRLQHLAAHDSLTGLANRASFEQSLELAIARARRSRGSVGVMFLDLDGFKAVNDTRGHDTGDSLLKEVAARLRAALRESDLVARIGGDEFTVLFDCDMSHGAVARLADKVLASIERPVVLEGGTCGVSASIGIALFPEHGDEAGEVLRQADIAMYRAKNSGKGRIEFADGQARQTG